MLEKNQRVSLSFPVAISDYRIWKSAAAIFDPLRGSHARFFFFFFKFIFYPGWHPYGQAGWLSTTQVIKGSLLLESGKKREGEKEKVLCNYELGDELATLSSECPLCTTARTYEKGKYRGST